METTQPTPTWDAAAHSEVIDAMEAAVGEVTYRVWGADWCGDCRATLPDFFAALEAAGVPDDEIEVHEVDEDKRGEQVEEYDVTLIPTIVVEREFENESTADGGDESTTADEDEPTTADEDEPTTADEDGSTEVARFEESEDRPAAEYVAERLLDADVLA